MRIPAGDLPGARRGRPRRTRRSRLSGAAVALAVAVAGCGAPAAPAGRLTVFAAASLTATFQALAGTFEKERAGTQVVFHFAASSTLAQQLVDGAPADVFAAASPETMATVTRAGVAAGPQTFVRNQLVIGVAEGNPKNLRSLADLARPGVAVARCAAQVPCGVAADRALRAADVTLRGPTLELNANATLTKLTLGEVDAALIYRTDALAAAAAVDAVDFPQSAAAATDYPIALISRGDRKELAAAFVALVTGERSAAAFRRAGFTTL
ncbi:molybdate-binding protein [Pilimelia terevasa]|uniref:Molybdate-binding protein n=1 Tax=Pilimelia terevasa TaxID=53372 RepID=A0A8J3FI74_9ACTN|nr:molybdate ABC transporter substrate-binding protein [Pilimelia terevasa]GGK17659.1 molybdate-binding protein [Pilimelia terevasa]